MVSSVLLHVLASLRSDMAKDALTLSYETLINRYISGVVLYM